MRIRFTPKLSIRRSAQRWPEGRPLHTVSMMSQWWLEPSMSLEDHARALLARLNCELVVINVGEEGSLAFTKATQANPPIYPPPVFIDTVGAGDGLIAGVLTALAEKHALTPGRLGMLNYAALVSFLRFGAADASINCGRTGCQPRTRA